MYRPLFSIFLSNTLEIILLCLFHHTIGDLLCSDTFSCGGEITENEAIWCHGSSSCNSASSLVADGYDINCGGSYSCSNTSNKLLANNGYLKCYGFQSCSDSNIETGKQIHCDGQNACFNTSITQNTYDGYKKSLQCDGDRSCAPTESPSTVHQQMKQLKKNCGFIIKKK